MIDKVQTLVLPKTAEAQSPAQDTTRRGGLRPGAGATRGGNVGAPPARRAGADSLRRAPAGAATRRVAPAVRGTPAAKPAPARPFQAHPNPRLQLSNWSQVATAIDRAQDADRRGDRYEVEVHKKWAISMACISFVIIGIVMALRFPRGGIGLVIGGGLAVFSIYYVGLTAGESLADRGIMAPWTAMWWPNIVLTIIGVIGLIRVSKESGSTRGGDFQELAEAIRHLVRRRRVLRPRRGA